MEVIHFKNLNLEIKKGDLISIIGPNGSGKSVLLKMISGRIKNDYIYIDNKSINEYSLEYKKENIVCVLDDNIYNTTNVREELRFYLLKLSLNINDIDLRINEFSEYFNLSNLMDKDFIDLNTEDRVYIKILSLLIIKPSLFCIDDLLVYLSIDKKNKILNYIKENNITFINVTSNMEDLMLFDKVLVMNKGEKYIFDDVIEVLKNEKLFKELGLSLPFIYDINNMLKSYDLINDYHIIYKELVDMLWK